MAVVELNALEIKMLRKCIMIAFRAVAETPNGPLGVVGKFAAGVSLGHIDNKLEDAEKADSASAPPKSEAH